MSTRAEALQRLRDYWNYVDVLSLVVAYSPLQKFPGTRAKWHEAIAKLRDEYGDRAPELFRDIKFERRDPLPPQSNQVAEFLRTLAWASITEEPNPAYQVVQLKSGQKRQIKERTGPRLAKYDSLIKEMSESLTREFED